MSKRKNKNPDDPRPLNFDHDVNKGPSDHLKEPFMTPNELRGDNQDDQYYEEEEAISPEEVLERKKRGDLADPLEKKLKDLGEDYINE